MVEEAEPTQRYVVTDAVYPIGDQGPPSQSANRYREHRNNELYGGVVALHHDRKAAKKHQIEEYNKRVGNGNQKGGCHYSGGFALTIVRAGRYIARCGKVEENAEKDQYDTPKELNSVAIGFDKIENEPHAQIGYGAYRRSLAAAPMPVSIPARLPFCSVRRTQSTPTGPMGQDTSTPISMP